MTHLIETRINDNVYSLEVKENWTLLQLLRHVLGLKGPKESCGMGECGSCTVIMDGKVIYSCLTLALRAEGKEILTIEGLTKNGDLHPLQKAFIECGAVQCGFCTPGMILAGKALLDNNPDPSDEEVRRGISGNLCRCTGYQMITDAVHAASKQIQKRS